MALVVEDGTGKDDADSYISVADADTYNTAHNADTVWDAADTSAKEKALRLATQYLDDNYAGRWFGSRSNADQALSWPRAGITDIDGYAIENDEMPQKLLDACTEAAIRSANGTSLMPDIDEPGTIKKERDKVDVIETEVEYVGGKSQIALFRIIDELLTGLYSSGGQLWRA